MVSANTITRPHQLKLYQPDNWLKFEQTEPQTPNQLFCQIYPLAFEKYGSAFIELVQPLDPFTNQVIPISINHDFFAGVLGGRRDLGHHVIYFEPEMQWYFKDADNIYKPTTPEKLMAQLRALMMKCAESMPGTVHKLNLFHEFRSDKNCKLIVQRAKSILAADHSFFSSTSPHQRIKGQEMFERLIRVLCETMLEKSDGACLTVSEAYRAFCRLSEQRQIGQLKRSLFKATMSALVKDMHGLGLRRDVPDALNKQQEAWRGLKLVDAEVWITGSSGPQFVPDRN